MTQENNELAFGAPAQAFLPGIATEEVQGELILPMHDSAGPYRCDQDGIRCPASQLDHKISIVGARERYHYRGGNMDGGEENIIRPDNLDTCNNCNRCIS